MPARVCALLHGCQVHPCTMHNAPSRCENARMGNTSTKLLDEDQEVARRFLREVARLTGWSLTKLAREAGMSHSTLTRFLNGEGVRHTLSARTIASLRRAAVAAGVSLEMLNQVWLIAQTPGNNPPSAKPAC
jgi:DNA-binding phage protein